MPRDSAAADRPASYLVGTAAAFPLFFRDRTKPINQLPFSPSAKFPKSGSSCESRASLDNCIPGMEALRLLRLDLVDQHHRVADDHPGEGEDAEQCHET